MMVGMSARLACFGVFRNAAASSLISKAVAAMFVNDPHFILYGV